MNGEGEFYKNTGIISRGFFKDNHRHGVWKLYVNGKHFAEEVYENGNLIEKNILDNELADKLQFNGSEKRACHPKSPFKLEEEEEKLEDDLTNPHRSSRILKTETSEYGLKTLSLIENFENLNSINLKVFQKNIEDWTNEDVSQWLIGIGLAEYTEVFTQNHITGKNIFDIEPDELKNEFKIHSVGHRKNILKSLDFLKTLYFKGQYFQERLYNIYIGIHETLSTKKVTSIDFPVEKTAPVQEREKENFSDPDYSERKKSVPFSNHSERGISKRSSGEYKSENEMADAENSSGEQSMDSLVFCRKSSSVHNNSNIVNKGKHSSQGSRKYSGSNQDILDFKLEEEKTQNSQNIAKEKPKLTCIYKKSVDDYEKTSKKRKQRKTKRKDHYNKPLNPEKEFTDEKNSLVKNKMREFGIESDMLIDSNELVFDEKIGEGAYGTIYSGTWLGQKVAIKKFKSGNSKKKGNTLLNNFFKEIEIISKLSSPHVVLFMGACVDPELIITEYADQGSLFDLIHKKKVSLCEEKMFFICQEIAIGMRYLHGRGILHCDLKSSNILVSFNLTQVDSNWNVKLCDFGLSNYKKNRKKPKYKHLAGTPKWMAPEVLRGGLVDEYSDVYSYGMIVWELLTREIPFSQMNVMQIIDSVGYEDLSVEMPNEGPELLIKLVRKCLLKEKKKRPLFKTITELFENEAKKETFLMPSPTRIPKKNGKNLIFKFD